jgi:hypothetical protein
MQLPTQLIAPINLDSIWNLDRSHLVFTKFFIPKNIEKTERFHLASRCIVTKFLSFENSEKTERCLSSRFVLKGCLSGAKNAPLQSKLFRF